MRITFVLPGWSRKPIGGFKIIYEYANRLAVRGHEIVIVHPLIISCGRMRSSSKLKFVIKWIIYILLGIKKLKWFNVFHKVKLLIVPNLKEKFIPDGDIIIATANLTAECVHGYGTNKGKKFHLIQGYKKLGKEPEKIDKAWKFSLKKIVISHWLEKEVLSIGEKVYGYVPNGIDFNRFHIITPIEKRNPKNIGMCYDPTLWKGSKDGIEALKIVKDRFPDINVTFFSIYKRTSEVPSWINYFHNPPQHKILEVYNSCGIFISPSWTEGWGLPAGEAIACGCALAVTDSGGIRDFAINEKTALVCPMRDPKALARNTIRLIEDNGLRLRLAKHGNEFVRQFTWERAIENLEKIIFDK
ncbi:MAG: glycosyltransferase family 4 protein [candidate division Zixibacteria bacterium]|nr:glycosyltransferase family 4 protein [candidate division Zixibacteria bacterium]